MLFNLLNEHTVEYTFSLHLLLLSLGLVYGWLEIQDSPFLVFKNIILTIEYSIESSWSIEMPWVQYRGEEDGPETTILFKLELLSF